MLLDEESEFLHHNYMRNNEVTSDIFQINELT